MDDMRKACVLTKDDPVIAANYAYALFKMGIITNSKSQVEEALDKFKQAVKKFPNSAFVYAMYGQVCMYVCVLLYVCHVVFVVTCVFFISSIFLHCRCSWKPFKLIWHW